MCVKWFTALLAAAGAGALSPAVAQETAPPAVALPALPAAPPELFAALAKEPRPQWRPLFREIIPHAGEDRFQSALALGAVCADCYLAAEARDTQQILNLLTDMAALEMTLSIARQAGGKRQKFKDLAEAGDWAGIRAETGALMTLHAQSLAAQQDEVLAELERTGLWLRAMHIGARYVSHLAAPPAQPCVWSRALLEDLQTRTAKITDGHEAKTLHTLNEGLASLVKTWTGATPPAATHAATLKTLDALMASLIADTAPKTP